MGDIVGDAETALSAVEVACKPVSFDVCTTVGSACLPKESSVVREDCESVVEVSCRAYVNDPAGSDVCAVVSVEIDVAKVVASESLCPYGGVEASDCADVSSEVVGTAVLSMCESCVSAEGSVFEDV